MSPASTPSVSARRPVGSRDLDETLAAVEELEPEYQETIRSPRLQGPAALLAAAGVLDPEEYSTRWSSTSCAGP